jgi:hypothetical protein
MPPLQPIKHVSLLPFVSEINFDTAPSGTVINNHYPGVTFVALPGTMYANSGSVFSSDKLSLPPQATPDSAPNVITINKPPVFAGFNEGEGIVRATFSSPQLYVSIDVLPKIWEGGTDGPLSPAALPYLSAFGQPIELKPPQHEIRPLLGTKSVGNNQDPQFETVWQRLEFVSTSPTPDIYSIQFSCFWSNPGRPVLGLFDRLRFSHVLPLPAKTLRIE